MNKVICKKCNMPSYTAATTSNVSCPFCGFLTKAGGLERRLRSKKVDSDRRLEEEKATHPLTALLNGDLIANAPKGV